MFLRMASCGWVVPRAAHTEALSHAGRVHRDTFCAARSLFLFLWWSVSWQNKGQQVALDPVCCVLRGPDKLRALACWLSISFPLPLPPSLRTTISPPRNAGRRTSPTSPSAPRPVSSPITLPASPKSHHDAHAPARLPQAKESPPVHSQLQ